MDFGLVLHVLREIVNWLTIFSFIVLLLWIYGLWSMALGLFGVTWVMPHMILGLLGCWQGNFGRH